MIKKISAVNTNSNYSKFVTNKNEPIQIVIHQTKIVKETRIHQPSPVQKYIYVIKGKIKIFFSHRQINKTILVKKNESIIFKNVMYKVYFFKNTKIIELKQGPYTND